MLEALIVALRQASKLRGERLQLLSLQGTQLPDLYRQRFGQPIQRLRLLLAVTTGSGGRLLTSARHLLPQFALDPFQSALHGIKGRFERLVLAPGALPKNKLQNQHTDRHGQNCNQQPITHT